MGSYWEGEKERERERELPGAASRIDILIRQA